MRPRWRKVWRDVAGHKVRTILVVAAIAISVFALGTLVGVQVLMSEDLAVRYAATNPASAILLTDLFDADFLDSVRHIEGVQEADAHRRLTVRLQVGPDEWSNSWLFVFPDYQDIRLNQVFPVSGAWPPARRSLLVERASLPYIPAGIGGTVVAEGANGRPRQLRITGVAHDFHQIPVQFANQPYTYTTQETLVWLGFTPGFDELRILVEGDNEDEAHVREVVARVERKLEKSGRTVHFTNIPEPGRHPAQDVVNPILSILGGVGGFSLLASAFLVVNTINGLLARQVNQIGVMKSIGARTGQVMQMYLATVLIYGLLALVIAVPLGSLVAYLVTDRVMAQIINFDLLGFRIPPQALLAELALGLLTPLLAALYPVIQGSRLTVREAISDYGLGQGHFGGSRLDRLAAWFSGRLLRLSRPMRISLRNTFRRKGRLALTLLTLTLSGAIFMAVLSVYASFQATLAIYLDSLNYDVWLQFTQNQRLEEMAREALKVPGVVQADSWLRAEGFRLRPDGTDGSVFSIVGLEPDTPFIRPAVVAGRWLLPEDTNAIVLNTPVQMEEADVQVGDTIGVMINGQERPWRVVGIVQGALLFRAYTNQPYLARQLGSVGRSDEVRILASQHDVAFQETMATRLREHFNQVGMAVNTTETIAQARDSYRNQFSLITIFLANMSVLLAIVGGLGLMGTMSLNVLERTREMGIMRAIGASNGAILRIVLAEGAFMGLLSWGASLVLAYPLYLALSNVLGNLFLGTPLAYRFSLVGALGWLAAILVIAALASYLPARNASRLSVRETLAYE